MKDNNSYPVHQTEQMEHIMWSWFDLIRKAFTSKKYCPKLGQYSGTGINPILCTLAVATGCVELLSGLQPGRCVGVLFLVPLAEITSGQGYSAAQSPIWSTTVGYMCTVIYWYLLMYTKIWPSPESFALSFLEGNTHKSTPINCIK